MAQNILIVLAPARATGVLLLPMGASGVALMLWLLVRGVDLPKWEARQPAADPA